MPDLRHYLIFGEAASVGFRDYQTMPKQGNPTLTKLESLLDALGFRFKFAMQANPFPIPPRRQPHRPSGNSIRIIRFRGIEILDCNPALPQTNRKSTLRIGCGAAESPLSDTGSFDDFHSGGDGARDFKAFQAKPFHTLQCPKPPIIWEFLGSNSQQKESR